MSIKKILIVDDSSTDLLHLKDILQSVTCTVITATSGMEAVSKAKSETPDLIFMDIVMDEMDGYKACREISNDNATSHIPVVFVTSKKNRADHIWAEKQGGKALVTKPYTADDIFAQVNAFNS